MRSRWTVPILVIMKLCILSACVPRYQGISLSTDGPLKMTDSLNQDGVFLGYRYGVMEAPGNKRYVRAEQQSGHQLIAMEIRNHRPDTLLFPEEIRFISGGDSLYIAGMEEAMTILNNESPEGWKESVEVDAPSAMFALDFFNTIKQVRSNLNFLDDMMMYYIVPQKMNPGDTIRGLICLKVEPDQKLNFSLTK